MPLASCTSSFLSVTRSYIPNTFNHQNLHRSQNVPTPNPTLRLDEPSEKLLTALRTRHFPSSRNFLSAHITLFPTLPPSSHDFLSRTFLSISARESPFAVGIKTPFALGKEGVGINIASFKLRSLHDELLDVLKGRGCS
jgi:hypothetical protein